MENKDFLKVFDERVKKFNRSYLTIVIAAGAVMAAAVTVAVLWRVSVGLLLGICGAVAYMLLLSDMMKRELGLWYKRTEGGIACSVISSKKLEGEKERALPERLMWLDVTALCAPEGKDTPDTCAETLYLPVSVKRIEADALSGMAALKRIVYGGSAEEWREVLCEADLSGIEIETQSAECEEVNEAP